MNPIVDCERNGERIENNRIEYEMKVRLENGNKSPFTNSESRIFFVV